MEEVWRTVPGLIYQVSNKNGWRQPLKNGYRYSKGRINQGRRLMSLGRGKCIMFHVCVAKAFPEICGEWFEGCHVHHKDFNPLNNVPENLVVMTEHEHLQLHYQYQPDSFKKPSEKRSKSISKALRGRRATEKHVPIFQYTLDGVLVKEWECISDVTSDGYSPGNVCSCCRGRLKTAGGYIWKYKKEA